MTKGLQDDASKPASSKDAKTSAKCERLLRRMVDFKGGRPSSDIGSDTIQLGKTKVFLRKQPYELLESRRSRLLYMCSVKVQSVIRMGLYKLWLLRLKTSTVRIQRCFKAIIARIRIKRRIDAKRLKRVREVAAIEASRRAVELRGKAERLTQEAIFKKIAIEAAQHAELKIIAKDAEAKALARKLEEAQREAAEAAAQAKSLEDIARSDDPNLDGLISPDLPASVKAAIRRSFSSRPFVLGPTFKKSTTPLGHFEASPVVDEDAPLYSVADMETDVKVVRLFNKHATKIDKELYRKQFPKAWSTVHLADIFGLDEK
jgi:hypothetical protein